MSAAGIPEDASSSQKGAMDIREWALSRFTPVVMVMATPQAEAVCQEKNGLSVTDMLRPYGAVHNISGAQLKGICFAKSILCITYGTAWHTAAGCGADISLIPHRLYLVFVMQSLSALLASRRTESTASSCACMRPPPFSSRNSR